MTRVTIEDLEEEKEISPEEMKAVFGGVRGAQPVISPGSRQFPGDTLTPGSGSAINRGTPRDRRSPRFDDTDIVH